MMHLQPHLAAWLSNLAAERRLAARTVEAYSLDVRQFLDFLPEHLGERPDLAALKGLRPADIRAFLAFRRKAG